MNKTIVYIHGFNSSSNVFNYLLKCLPKHAAITVDYDSTQSVKNIIAQISHRLPDTEYYVVAHSLGGLVAHQLALSDSNVRAIISVSSPFGGHDIAGIISLFYPHMKVLRDLNPFSRVIKACKTIKPAVEWVNVITTDGSLPFIRGINDGVVSVESQRAGLADSTVEINTNHFEVMQHPRLVSVISKCLRDK